MIYRDLTLSFSPDETAGFAKRAAKLLAIDGWNASTLEIYSHAGTHMDAPVHFGISSQTIDQMEVSDFICENTWVLNLNHVPNSHLITLDDLGELTDQISEGDGLLLRTDWYKKIGTAEYREKLPRISEELAEFLVAKGLKILGVEPPSVADVNNLAEVTRIHQILLGHVLIVEGLCQLDTIQAPKVTFIALPLKIKGGDGAPCRAIAIEK